MADEQFATGGLPPKPPQYSDLEWQALHAGAELRRGRQYEDDEPVHEIRWPNGAVTDLLRTTPLRPLATGGYVRLDAVKLDSIASDITHGHSCWVAGPTLVISPDGVTLTWNFEGGFTGNLTGDWAHALQLLGGGAAPDPRVDEEWDAWRCPACGQSHDEVGAGHAWFVDGAGNATCNGGNA